MRRMYSENQLQEQVKNQLAEGKVNNVKVFENIVDKDGHKRFIEGVIAVNEITGVSIPFAKWALSGTHLLIVLAGTIADTTDLSSGTKIFNDISIPDWVRDKIVNINANRVAYINQYFYADDDTNQNATLTLNKRSDNKIDLIFYSSITFTKDRAFRTQIDLLIDNA